MYISPINYTTNYKPIQQNKTQYTKNIAFTSSCSQNLLKPHNKLTVNKLINIYKSLIYRLTSISLKNKDINNWENNLANIKLGKFINQGTNYKAYESNNPDWIIKIRRGCFFNTSKLEKIEDKFIYAQTPDKSIQIAYKVKGEPLHGKCWNILEDADKKTFMETFEKVKNLPDKSFKEYMTKLLELRKDGYDIDYLNPNNILLDGNKINIVDLEKESTKVCLRLSDIEPFVDEFRLKNLLIKMPTNEQELLIKQIRAFIGRMIRISRSAGSKIEIEGINRKKHQNILTCIYNDDKYMLDILLKKRLNTILIT